MQNEAKELKFSPEGLLEILSGYLTAKYNKPIKVKQKLQVYTPGYHEDDDTRVDLFYMLDDQKHFISLDDIKEMIKDTIDENYEIQRLYFMTDAKPNKVPVYKGLKVLVTEKQMRLTKKPKEE